MVLVYFLLILFLAGPLAWALEAVHKNLARWTTLVALLIDGAILAALYLVPVQIQSPWIVELLLPWIPKFGASLHLALDGISLLLIALTLFLGIAATISSWNEVTEKVGLFHCNLLWLLAFVSTLFMALDLLLFYFAWELMLVPTYFLISLFGSNQRLYAAKMFFLYTQLGGLFLLTSIIALYCLHGCDTFEYKELLATNLSTEASFYLMLGFLAAFCIKMPVVPFHAWAIEAYSNAPTAISLLLAGLLSKTGAYGILRFVLPLFQGASFSFVPIAWILSLFTILYAACVAFSQTDLKRLLAYSSISHMGFIFLGLFSTSPIALKGAIIIMIAHGLATGALFIIAGQINLRLKTGDLTQLGGLWAKVPILSAIALFFTMASLGLPGLGNFVGDLLVVLGLLPISLVTSVIAAIGFVLAAIYLLWMFQRTFYGPSSSTTTIQDLSAKEIALLGCMMAASLWIGLYPSPFFEIMAPPIQRMQERWGALPPIPPGKGLLPSALPRDLSSGTKCVYFALKWEKNTIDGIFLPFQRTSSASPKIMIFERG